MSRKLVIPRLNASGRAPRYSDVDLMLRSRPRIIMLDGGIPPATPLPTKHWAGGFASLPCDSFAERALLGTRTNRAPSNQPLPAEVFA